MDTDPFDTAEIAANIAGIAPGSRVHGTLTEAALAAPDCGFEPLLPDEYAPLPERVAALSRFASRDGVASVVPH